MSEFGHTARRLPGGGFLDSWGCGPFEILVDGKRIRFEDSDMFGPVKLNRNGDPSSAKPWGAHHSFWTAHRQWVRNGRLLAADGITCIFQPPRPTIIRTLAGRHALLILEGQEGGPTLEMESPEGQEALSRARKAGLFDDRNPLSVDEPRNRRGRPPSPSPGPGA